MKITKTQMDRIIQLAKDYGADRLILFGSYLNNPDDAHDLDLACDGIGGWKIFEFGGQLENELRIPVDVVPLTPESRLTQLIEKKRQSSDMTFEELKEYVQIEFDLMTTVVQEISDIRRET